MGRTSKFLFPNRRIQSTRSLSKAEDQPPQPSPLPAPPPPSTQGLSKAQRILGTGGFNVDASHSFPPEDDHHHHKHQIWRKKSRSSMTPSNALSIQDSDEQRRWEAQVPRSLRAKASSTLFGQGAAGNEGSTDTSSQNESSSSTLRSPYDRHLHNLLITQQTSSSSARDLALRKGMAMVTSPQPSPLSKVDSAGKEGEAASRGATSSRSDNTSRFPKKKLGRLDLSKLFPKPRQDTANPILLDPDEISQSPSAVSFVSACNTYHFPQPNRALSPIDAGPPPPPEHQPETRSIIKPRYSLPHIRNVAAIPQRTSSRNLYAANASMGRVVENLTGPQLMSLHTSPPCLDSSTSPTSKRSQFSWKHAQASAAGTSSSVTWDSGSAVSTSAMSMSSRNTRGSKRTTASIFETVDLQVCSVLSLTSDEDSSDEDADRGLEYGLVPAKQFDIGMGGRAPSGGAPGRIMENGPAHRRTSSDSSATGSAQQPTPRQSKTTTRRSITSKKIPKSRYLESQFLQIPLPSPTNSRLSGPWGSGDVSPLLDSFPGVPGQESASPVGSIGTSSPLKIDTPPLSPLPPSPASVGFSQASGKNSRFMAVNAQERALLEALRSRKARMAEDSIAEDDELSPRSSAAPSEAEFYSKKELPPSPPRQRSLRSKKSKPSQLTPSRCSNAMSSLVEYSIAEDEELSPRSSAPPSEMDFYSKGELPPSPPRHRSRQPRRSKSSHALREMTTSRCSSALSSPLEYSIAEDGELSPRSSAPPSDVEFYSKRQLPPSPRRQKSRKPRKSKSSQALRESAASHRSTARDRTRPVTSSGNNLGDEEGVGRSRNRSNSRSQSSLSHTAQAHQRRTSRGNILLYLERQALEPNKPIQTAEPSPDLSEFYRESFGLGQDYRYYSDEEPDVPSGGDATPTTMNSSRSRTRYSNSSFNDYDSIIGNPATTSADPFNSSENANSNTGTARSFTPTRSFTQTRCHPMIPPRLSAVGGPQAHGPPQPLYRHIYTSQHQHQRGDSVATAASAASGSCIKLVRDGQGQRARADSVASAASGPVIKMKKGQKGRKASFFA